MNYSMPIAVGPMLTDRIDRWRAHRGRKRQIPFATMFLPLKPVIIRGAFDHPPVSKKWSLRFRGDRHGDLQVRIGGNLRKLGEFIEEVLALDAGTTRPVPP